MIKGKYYESNKAFLELVVPLDIVVRIILIPFITGVICLSIYLGLSYPLLPILSLFAFFLLYNQFVFWLIKKGLVEGVITYFIILVIDCVLNALAIYVTGGVESIVIIIYGIIAVLAGLTLPLWGVFGVIAGGAISYLAELGLEAQGIIPHISIFKEFFPQSAYLKSNYIRMISVSYISVFVGTTFLAYFVATLMRKRSTESAILNDELNKSSKLLVRHDMEMTVLNDEMDIKMKELEDVQTGLEQKVAERTKDLSQKVEELNESQNTVLHIVEELRKANKMKDEFISIVSHELRTPLTPIIDYAMILRDGLAKEQTAEIYNRLLACAQRELNLVNSMLDVSRLEAGFFKPNKSPVFFKKVVEDSVVNIADSLKGKDLKVEMDLEEETIMADINLLVRAVSQLLDNAIKFTPKGGAIKVTCRPADGALRFEIKDTGIGIAKEHLVQIFDKFYQIDASYTRRYGGVGLGLTLVRQIVEAHNGKVWAESKGVGMGTTIIFEIPVL